jgi:small conductance mechanosensitive channel
MNIDLLLPELKIATLKAHAKILLPDFFAAAVTVVLGYLFYKLTARLFRSILLRSHVDDAFSHLLVNNVYKTIVIVVTGVLVVGEFGVNIVAPLAGLGVLGLALGFAAKDSLSNIISGFLIFFDKPFRVGDYITIADQYGRVELITMRSTRIRTQDNTYVVIPNLQIINDVLVDHSSNGDTRIIVPVSISYSESIQHAREAILKEVSQIDGVLEDPSPDVVVDKLADSGINLQVRVWIRDASFERRIFFATTERTREALGAAGIEIPYPHVQLKIDEGQKITIEK